MAGASVEQEPASAEKENVEVEKVEASVHVLAEQEKLEAMAPVSDEAENTGAKKPEAKETQRAYCGPTIKGVANQNSVFIGELPAALKEASEKCKAVQRLIVPLEHLPKVMAAVSTQGTPENAFFRKAAEYGKGVK